MGAIRISATAGIYAVDAVTSTVSGGTLNVYTGTAPASPDYAATGTLLVTFDLGAPAFADATADGAGTLATATLNTVADATAVATGTAGWFRMLSSSGSGRIDGDVGTSGQELNLSTTSIASGGTVSITSGSITGPA